MAFAATMIRPGYLLDSMIARKVSAPEFSHSLDPKEKFAVPEESEHRSVTTLREKPVKIGGQSCPPWPVYRSYPRRDRER